MAESFAVDLTPPADRGRHIVDVLIEERAPHLASGPLWRLIRPPLYAILNYRKAVQMADAIEPMGGQAALDFVSRILKLRVETVHAERIPKADPFLLLLNHPTGITDGIAVYDIMKTVRPDAVFYANADAHRVCRGFFDNLIPVEWVTSKRTRERTRLTLKMTGEAIAARKPIIIFPAGRLARIRANGMLTDPEWLSTAASLARKYSLPVLPCHIAGPYAFWFHFFDRFSRELRDITLFHELLNKQGKTYRLTFGRLIPAGDIQSEAVSVTRRMKHYIERVLPADPDRAFDPSGPECAWRDSPADDFQQG